MLVVLPAAQLSHPPSRSGWLADDVILGVSFTSLSGKIQTSKVTLVMLHLHVTIIHCQEQISIV